MSFIQDEGKGDMRSKLESGLVASSVDLLPTFPILSDEHLGMSGCTH